MPTTVIVEPDPGGHRFQSVAFVADVALARGSVVLLTSAGATRTPEFANFLGEHDIEVLECFDEIYPPTRLIARAIAEQCRRAPIARALVMDADQSLKRWWLVARQEFRGLSDRPRINFMLTRYPAKLALTDHVGWKLRLTKGALALAARATGTLHHVVGYTGRDDASRGWLVARVRDPAVCSAHSRDRAALRARFGLPLDTVLVGIFGVITARKNAPFVLDAIKHSGVDALLLVAGAFDEECATWLRTLSPADRTRVIARDQFLSDAEFDRYVACADVIALPLTNNGPSGIMGKALAAGVPVVSAGSVVRERELLATGGGEAAPLTVDGFGIALAAVLQNRSNRTPVGTLPDVSPRTYAAMLLGIAS